jgi:hypothetical protein
VTYAKHGASAGSGTVVVMPKTQVWSKPLPNGAAAVLLVNLYDNGTAPVIETTLTELGLSGSAYTAFNIWTGTRPRLGCPLPSGARFTFTDLAWAWLGATTTITNEVTVNNVPIHGSVFVRLTPQ